MPPSYFLGMVAALLHITTFNQRQNHVNNIDIPTKNLYNGHTMYKGE